MSSRSPSSSPDVLGPPGDAEYLISSPIKPFVGRQSWMSPANFKMIQTPRRRQQQHRISLSPARSAHSIRFDDILLPASPTMKLNGRQRSTSPGKGQEDRSGSPWRIRVTLEATQDDDQMNEASPSRKRLKLTPATTTIKVPLKGDGGADLGEQTPKRRRGRPRKSDLRTHVGTPNGPVGSPGHTPGPSGTSGQKRPRGRPRKSAPVADEPQQEPAQQSTPDLGPEPRRSPVNLAADGDSDDGSVDGMLAADPFGPADDLVDAETPAGNSPPPSPGALGTMSRQPSLEGSQGHSIHGDDDEMQLLSTPIRMASPTQDKSLSTVEHTLHAGNTPRSRRTMYPSPTSSPPGGNEAAQQQGAAGDVAYPTLNGTDAEPEPADPTDEHHEFDSIIESEGFSMVSLGTLPSARQHGVGSEKRMLSGALKPFFERQSGTFTDKGERSSSAAATDSNRANTAPVDTQPHSAMSVPRNRLSPSRSPQPSTHSSPDEHATPGPQESLPQQAGPSDSPPPPSADSLRAQIRIGKSPQREYPAQANERQTPVRALAREHRLMQLDSEMRRREEEWQREREAVSREIEMANSSQVIVIDSDGSTPGSARGLGTVDGLRDRDQSGSDSEPQPVSVLSPVPEPDATEKDQSDFQPYRGEEEVEDDDNEGDYDDIWQQEAIEQSYDSQSQLNRRLDQRATSSRGHLRRSVPRWRRGATNLSSDNNSAFSPAHWNMEMNEEIPFLGESKVKRLREQDVDLAALLRSGATPSRSLKSYEGSSPLKVGSTASSHGQPSPHVARRDGRGMTVTNEDRLGEGQGAVTERSSGIETRALENERPAKRIGHEIPRSDADVERSRHGSVPHAAAAAVDALSSRGSVLVTPEPAQPANTDMQGASWFRTLASFTPSWLRAPNSKIVEPPVRQSVDSHAEDGEEVRDHTASQDVDVYSDVHGSEGMEEQKLLEEDSSSPLNHALGDRQHTPLTSIEPDEEVFHQNSLTTSSRRRAPEKEHPYEHQRQRQHEAVHDNEDDTQPAPAAPSPPPRQHKPQPPLALSGYFTDAHYAALRRLYRLAKRFPDHFPYHPTPGRAEIIGDWIWTSDGTHGVAVTEVQFAIIDRFVEELVAAARQYRGGDDDDHLDQQQIQIGWTEAELHKRLVSVIIGEQIRKEREVGANVDVNARIDEEEEEHDMNEHYGSDRRRPSHGQGRDRDRDRGQGRGRDTSVDTWRRSVR